jgi:prophage antirepressor-like protein
MQSTRSRLICGTPVSLRRLVAADGQVWLNARDFAAATGYSTGHAVKLVREQAPKEHCCQLRDLAPDSRANDLYLLTEGRSSSRGSSPTS